MIKTYKEILWTPVYVDDEIRPVSTIKDLVLDPFNGSLVAVIVNKNKNLGFAPMDLVYWDGKVKIRDASCIFDVSEILRAEEILKKDIKIIRNKVFDEDGAFLGKVSDYSFNTNPSILTLTSITVTQDFLGLINFEKRLIPAKNIVEILTEKIIVKSDSKVREPKSVHIKAEAVG